MRECERVCECVRACECARLLSDDSLVYIFDRALESAVTEESVCVSVFHLRRHTIDRHENMDFRLLKST